MLPAQQEDTQEDNNGMEKTQPELRQTCCPPSVLVEETKSALLLQSSRFQEGKRQEAGQRRRTGRDAEAVGWLHAPVCRPLWESRRRPSYHLLKSCGRLVVITEDILMNLSISESNKNACKVQMTEHNYSFLYAL